MGADKSINRSRTRIANDKPAVHWVVSMLLPALFWSFILAAGALSLLKLLESRYFSVQSIHLQGTMKHLDHVQVRKRLNYLIGKQLFAINLSQVQKQLGALPWVARVTLRRHWPRQLDVELTERQAVAYWNGQSLIDNQGHVFKPQVLPHLSLVRLHAPDSHRAMIWSVYEQTSPYFHAMGLSLQTIDQFGINDWRFVFKSGLRVQMASLAYLTQVQQFKTLFPRIMQGHKKVPVDIDFRYKNGFAVQW